MEVNKIIIRPIISENSLKELEANKYVFEVDKKANKFDIAKAIKEKFDVDVLKVRTSLTKGRSRRILGRKNRSLQGPFKKATVLLGKNQKIDIFETKGKK